MKQNFKTVHLNQRKKETHDESGTPHQPAPFQPASTVSKTFMPQEEMKLYTKLAWSYKNKNLNLPRNASGNNTFDSFNKSRTNYMEAKF
jgi:hypothetical protein